MKGNDACDRVVMDVNRARTFVAASFLDATPPLGESLVGRLVVRIHIDPVLVDALHSLRQPCLYILLVVRPPDPVGPCRASDGCTCCE